MRRIQEKVKDIVEVRSYDKLADYLSSPADTLARYHFTPSTADLMAKWIDAVSRVHAGAGASFALAGYRGVGKSHFLAALSAIIANPELRSRINDAHVMARAQGLKRRRIPVAHIRRGTAATFIDEFRVGISEALGVPVDGIPNDITACLESACTVSPDVPFVILIDTAVERPDRVSRNDGAQISEIAKAAATQNIFVAVALDDDIAGADGANSSIVRDFWIDYLDQDHLFKIVDAHIFPKHRQAQPILQELYQYLRTVAPAFKWSEQRFAALYPIHPALLELAPFVRLYVQDFSLLSFASNAGSKILGRPVNSLIGLDELFDHTEKTLRAHEQLKEVFEVYDKLVNEVVSQIPIMERLQAKLVLRALFLLSLSGEGGTADEIAGVLLLIDEREPLASVNNVGALLQRFYDALPEGLSREQSGVTPVRYAFRVSGKESLNEALSVGIAEIDNAVIDQTLRKFTFDRYSDWTISPEASAEFCWQESVATWRGGARRGRVKWCFDSDDLIATSISGNSEITDWHVLISPNENSSMALVDEKESPVVFWQPDKLRKDEQEAVMKYHVLLTDPKIAEEYPDQFSAVCHSQKITVERIWSRTFLEDGKFRIDGFDFNFTEEARVAETVADLLSIMLEPLFETRYPEHPFFAENLGHTQVSQLVSEFFSGSKADSYEIQRLAEIYAAPLGLVVSTGSGYQIDSETNLRRLPYIDPVLQALERQPEDKPLRLDLVAREMRQKPFGIVREAQQLILGALVAQRQVEFVTSKGDRIGRRSLDLKIIWDDIVGIALPTGKHYSSERLSQWLKILTGALELEVSSVTTNTETAVEALQNWFDDWKVSRVLERFAELPDDVLNTRTWQLAHSAGRTFGSVSETVDRILKATISLDEGLYRIADAFSDSEEEYLLRANDLIAVEDFISGATLRKEITSYLAVCEGTNCETTERYRKELLLLLDESYANPRSSINMQLAEVWERFKASYVDVYATEHDHVMKAHHLHEEMENILNSDFWWEFEWMSQIPLFQKKYWHRAQALCNKFKQMNCTFSVRQLLEKHPFCACKFAISTAQEWGDIPTELKKTITQGRNAYRVCLRTMQKQIDPLIDNLLKRNDVADLTTAALTLSEKLKGAKMEAVFSNDELFVLHNVLEDFDATSEIESVRFATRNASTKDEIETRVEAWLQTIPNPPINVRVP